ncbi:hypothetical protein [Bradyrhizobium sp.]
MSLPDRRRRIIEYVGRVLFEESSWRESLAGMMGVDLVKFEGWCASGGRPPADIIQRLRAAVTEYERCAARNSRDAAAALQCFEQVVGD